MQMSRNYAELKSYPKFQLTEIARIAREALNRDFENLESVHDDKTFDDLVFSSEMVIKYTFIDAVHNVVHSSYPTVEDIAIIEYILLNEDAAGEFADYFENAIDQNLNVIVKRGMLQVPEYPSASERDAVLDALQRHYHLDVYNAPYASHVLKEYAIHKLDL